MTATAALDRTTNGPAATAAVGERLGRELRRGDVVLLRGELGTGKTCFTQGIARGLGSTDTVSSPSFVLVNEYRGRVPIFHADLYRLGSLDELEELGLWDDAASGVLVIEWPERGEGGLPGEGVVVEFRYGEGPCDRHLRILPLGSRGREILEALGAR